MDDAFIFMHSNQLIFVREWLLQRVELHLLLLTAWHAAEAHALRLLKASKGGVHINAVTVPVF